MLIKFSKIAGIMAFVSVLGGCFGEGRTFYCNSYDTLCALNAVSDMRAYIDAEEPDVAPSQQSFLMLQHPESPDRSTNTVVLVHGFTGSPLHMKSTANTFYELGFNVVSILLSGHGTSVADMHENGKLFKWRNDIRYAVNIASALSDRVILGGHSLGGALAMEYAIEHADDLDTLVLFDPMISLHERFRNEAIGSCAAPLLEVVADVQVETLNEYKNIKGMYGIEAGITNDSFNIFPSNYPGSYDDASMRSVCSMLGLIKRFYTIRDEIDSVADKNLRWYTKLETVPNVLMVYSSDAANIVSYEVNRGLMAFVLARHPDYNYHALELPVSEGVAHGIVLDPDLNPLYPEIVSRITEFVRSL